MYRYANIGHVIVIVTRQFNTVTFFFLINVFIQLNMTDCHNNLVLNEKEKCLDYVYCM